MTVPDFQTIMLPMLLMYQDGEEHSNQAITKQIVELFKLTPEDVLELLPSGRQTRLSNRISWSRAYLTKARILQKTRSHYAKITERGLQVIAENPSAIDLKYLKRFQEIVEFRRAGNRTVVESVRNNGDHDYESRSTPEEAMEESYLTIRANLAQELIDQVKKMNPTFFEKLVVELLVRMGYGGSRIEAARAVGQAGDGGIDGMIDEDRLGLDTIYIQAKRWEGSVGRPEVQKFVGALMGKKARKGVFITTSGFSDDAVRYVSNIDYKVVLIDGQRLSELMMDYDLGVTEVTTYRLKRIDSDYFQSS